MSNATTPVRRALSIMALVTVLHATSLHAETLALEPEIEVGGDGTFYAPEVVREDDRGHVFVLDSRNHRVVELDHEGAMLGQIGSIGSGPGELLNPVGMDIDEEGNLLIADLGNTRIQILSREGEVLSILQGDRGLSDVIALPGRELLMSRSFMRGRALFYRVRYDGSLVEFVGQRLGAGEGLHLEVSLNTYRGTIIDGDLWVAFANLARVERITGGKTQSSVIDVRTQGVDEVHAQFHRDVLASFGVPQVCGPVTVERLREDLRLACSEASTRFTTYVAGVGGFDGRMFVMTFGVVHELDPSGRVVRTYRLTSGDGSEAFAHRMWISPSGACYTVDSFHHHIVRRYNLVVAGKPGVDRTGTHR